MNILIEIIFFAAIVFSEDLNDKMKSKYLEGS